MDNYDVVIVGSGTAGQTAAYELNAHKMRVAVIEKSDRPGGTCALAGCQAKKWFYEITETVARSGHLHGLGIEQMPVWSWPDTLKQKNKFTSRVPDSTVEGLKSAGIEYIKGDTRFLDPDTMVVDGKKISAGRFILATGAQPMSLPIDGAEHLITSEAFLELDELPERMVFVGGGFISFEFAHFAARLGPENRRITILEAGDRPLGPFDQEVVEWLSKASQDEGVEIRTKVEILSVIKKGTEYKISTRSADNFTADLVIHGAGRTPDIEHLGLESGGVEFDRRGIRVNPAMQSTNPKVYAVGDCANTIQLARVADCEALVAAKNIITGNDQSEPAEMDYTTVPAVLFTYPQYGMVGKTEAALIAEGIDYRKSAGNNLGWPTYKRIGMKHAGYKIMSGSDGRILGAHILSDNCSGLINTIRQAMIHGSTVGELHWQSLMTPYPSRESDLVYMLKPLLDDSNG
ncbi:MAG: NAD(P)/FAD-dependent oxidoreductase [Desulfobacteraceae bacterium]|nr:NAD(P)/FAD-dependent oxidoreductase [Desulfobacteraceae bacterium]